MSIQSSQTLQLWPGGASYTIAGDPHDPSVRRLKTAYGTVNPKWRKGTIAEWRKIIIELRAENYRDRDVLACQSGLVDELLKRGDVEGFDSTEDVENLYADPSSWDIEECREWLDDKGIDHEALVNETDEEAWRDLVRDNATEYMAEVFEWWLVSDWLCKQLKEIGEVVIDNGYGSWWGRTCTGQGFIMDGTLQQIAARFD